MRAHFGKFVSLSAAILVAAAGASAGLDSAVGFYRVSERVAIGGQPTPEEITALSGQSFNTIVNLREESEFNDGPLSHAARSGGMQFVRVPVAIQKPSDAAVEKFLLVTDDESLYPVFIYCATGNRAAALWMVRRVVREKWSLADAASEAERAGLTNPAMREFALDYIRRHATTENP